MLSKEILNKMAKNKTYIPLEELIKCDSDIDYIPKQDMQFPKPTKVKRWNTKRNISNELKEYIIERDQVCVICKYEYIQTIHHCECWNMAMYWKNRNDPEFCVWLCDKCHHSLHFSWDNNYRDQAIQYLNNYYENNSKG